MSNPKKTMDLQKLVQQPSSLKLLILHTPFPLQISTLWRCTNLIKLDLSKNNLQSFPHIGNLANLKFMFLHQNKLDHHILRGIFYSERQPSYSPLSKSIVWVTYWGNKNVFFARHFLVNETSVIAVDNYMVAPEQRKQSVLESGIQPFSSQTDVSYILENKQSLTKTATEEQYMDQFWKQMRELRKNMQVISPIIKIQKVFRGWVVRKQLRYKKQQVVQSLSLKDQSFKAWKQLFIRNKKLMMFLKKRNKQHYLLPLRQMKLQTIKFKMLRWAARAKQKVLMRKLSLQKEVRFYQTLRSNMLMFRSLYSQLQLQRSNFLLIDAQNFKLASKAIENFISLFNEGQTFKVETNSKFLVRQVTLGSVKRQFTRFLNVNQRSYVIRLDYEEKRKSNTVRCLMNQNVCSIPTHTTSLKPLFKNENKVHFNTFQRSKINKHMSQLQKRQKLILEEFVLIKGSNKVLKDFVRCVFYLNTKAIKLNSTNYVNQNSKIQLFSERSVNKLASVVLIQKLWRGFIFRKKQKTNAQLCAKQYRAVVKIQRWVRNLPQKKKYASQNQLLSLIKLINDPWFIVRMDDYLKLVENVENPENNYLSRMKIIEQNLVPYFNTENKKITLFWNPHERGSPLYNEKIKICSENKKPPFSNFFINSIFKSQNSAFSFKYPMVQGSSDENFHRGDFSHYFHFNTITSLAQKDNQYWMKIYCSSVEQAKMRVLGILSKSYSFKHGFGIKIYGHEIVDFKKHFKKNILSNQSIFITKGDTVLKQDSSKIQKFNFKSKIYLKEDENAKPVKLEENMIIFAHNFKSQLKKSKMSHERSISEPNVSFLEESKKQRKRAKLYVDQMRFAESNEIQVNSTIEMQPRSITISQDQSFSQAKISKQDLLPTALKKILPLKKQIKSYKLEKKLKIREPSFVLDNANKQERIMTEPDLPMNESFGQQKQQKSQFEYSTVKEKIKKNYIYRKNLMKSQKQDFSFHQNFINLNNFLQQQSICEQRRRIKTELQIGAYESADIIRVSMEKSADQNIRKKQDKMKRVQQDIKNHKITLQKHRQHKEQYRQELQRIKSVQREKRTLNNHQQVRRLKVSFAEQCFPILNRSYNTLRSQSGSMQKKPSQNIVSKRFHLSSTEK